MLDINDPRFIELVTNGLPIEELEKRLRPSFRLDNYQEELKAHAGYEDSSCEGFLGLNESLLSLVHEDWKTLERYNTSHSEIADKLERLILRGDIKEKLYQFFRLGILKNDYGFKEPSFQTMGTQSCPWGCNVHGQNTGMIFDRTMSQEQRIKAEFGEKNNSSGNYALLTELLPHLIREHYFFEGKDSPYRADPLFLIKAFKL